MRLLAGYIGLIVIFGHMPVYKAKYVGYKVVRCTYSMVSLILDLLAPKAKAELNLELKCGYDDFIEGLGKQHKVLSSNGSISKFRIKGDFFSDLRATKVLIGQKANPKHYGKVGFDLEVHSSNTDQILLKAEERVIFGYLELKAVGNALSSMLENLASSVESSST